MFLTPSVVESAYKHVSEICCFYLQVASKWCVLWSVYVGRLVASETQVMVAVYSSEMPVSIYCATRCHSLYENKMKTDHFVDQKIYN